MRIEIRVLEYLSKRCLFTKLEKSESSKAIIYSRPMFSAAIVFSILPIHRTTHHFSTAAPHSSLITAVVVPRRLLDPVGTKSTAS